MKSTYSQLLNTVRLLFASDIPWEAQSDQTDESTKIAFENTGTFIKACMQEMSIYIPVDVDEIALYIAVDLRPFLIDMQELLLDSLNEGVDISQVSNPWTAHS